MFTCGTSHYLKHTFGVGYNLTIVKKPDCDEDKLENTILAHIPSASLLTNVGAEMTYQLPFNTSDKFVALFTEFDDNLARLGIQTYGVSVTTMEEVFLNSAKVVDKEFARSLSSKRNLTGQGVSCAEGARHLAVDREEEKKRAQRKDFTRTSSDLNEKLFGRHFRANFQKRFRYAMRDKKMFIMELLIPGIFTLLVFTMVKVIFSFTNVDSYPMDTRYYNPQLNETFKGRSRFVYDDFSLNTTDTLALFDSFPRDRFTPQSVNITDLKTNEVCSSLAKYLWCNDPVRVPSSPSRNSITLRAIWRWKSSRCRASSSTTAPTIKTRCTTPGSSAPSTSLRAPSTSSAW